MCTYGAVFDCVRVERKSFHTAHFASLTFLSLKRRLGIYCLVTILFDGRVSLSHSSGIGRGVTLAAGLGRTFCYMENTRQDLENNSVIISLARLCVVAMLHLGNASALGVCGHVFTNQMSRNCSCNGSIPIWDYGYALRF
jgi:hypothetical protein